MSHCRNQHQNACGWCGVTQRHEQDQCPARNARCRNCGKRGHYDKVCRSKTIRTLDKMDNIDALPFDYNGDRALADIWQAEISVNHKLIKFKLDTVKNTTVLRKHLFEQLFNEPLLPADKCLCGSNRAELDITGYFTATLKYDLYAARCVEQRRGNLPIFRKPTQVQDTPFRLGYRDACSVYAMRRRRNATCRLLAASARR